MKSPYIAELQPSQLANGTFLVQVKDVRQKKSGEHYLSLVLADRTGDIDAKMWDNVDRIMDTFERDDFVRVKGMPQVYQNRLQLTVHTLSFVADSEVDLADFFPASKRDPAEMWAELEGHVSRISNPFLRQLLADIMGDAEIARKLKRAPAAKSIHHAWLGGLLEHILSLCRLVELVAPHYPHLDRDLVMTGAVLHDIGKIDELSYERTFGYTDNGQLLGHILLGLRMVDDKMRAIADFPSGLRTLVNHLVVSHHGELSYGSPKVPLCGEAMLLHHLDNMDSKIECMRSTVEKDKLVDGCWTSYVSSLDRPVLKRDRFLTPASEIQARVVAPRNTADADRPEPTPVQQPAGNTSLLADKLRAALKGER
jgi:3'-5' exoribonuclease